MPFKRPTLTELVDAKVADIEARMPDADARLRRSFLDVIARVEAGSEHGIYAMQKWIADQILPDTAEAEILDRQASIWGVARGAATFAAGNVTLTGTNGTVIPAGTPMQRTDGVEYATSAEATIAAGTASVAVAAVDAGDAGNADAGTGISLVSPIAGVTSAGTVAAGGLTGGVDEEADTALLARVLARIQQPPHGGARFDYVEWALAQPGVTRAWVYPQELGLGTVTVRFMMDDTYDDGIPLEDDVDDVQDALDLERPVTADLTVAAPEPVELDITFTELSPATAAVKAAIEAELRDLIRREAEPGSTILISHIREAISIAAGETDHAISAPSADVDHDTGEIAVLGTIDWGA